ncbi:hypothetical protein [Enemella evansiae]|uniref:hypothetical protein n=1 Tax=Enemella evansiae TaxID=2016499 RepID=UPI00117CEA7E|nr:hypothetical protein [Enemella evansiae]
MRPEVVRRIVAGYAIALGVLALILVPRHQGPEAVSGASRPVETQSPSPTPSPTAAPTPAQTPAPAPVTTAPAREATPAPSRTHRTDRTPAPDPNRTVAAPPTAAASPVAAPPRGGDAPPARPRPGTQTTAPGPDGPPGDFEIISSTSLSECNGGNLFTVAWSRSEGATRYTVYASNQGSVIVGGTSTTLACPTRAGSFTVTVIAYNDRMQGTNAPTVTYHEPEPLDDPTPSPGWYETAPPTSSPSRDMVNRAPAPSASPTN